MSSVFGALAAGGLVLGLMLVVQAFRSDPPPKQRRMQVPSTGQQGVAVWLLGSLVAFLAAWVASGWIAVGFGAAGLVWVGRLWLVASEERRAFHEITEALSVWIDMVRDSLSGGMGLSQAIEATTRVAPEILKPHVVRLASLQRTQTVDFSAALREFADSVDHPTADLVVLALIAAHENQVKQLPQLLAKTAAQARARNTVVLQIESERSKLYTEARAMVLAIAVLGAIISVVASDFLKPYGTGTGQIVLTVIMALVVGSAALLVQVGRPKPEPRLLNPGQ